MEKSKRPTHLFRSDEIITIVLSAIGIEREEISTYKDYSYSDGRYLRLRVSDHGLFLQNWYTANKTKRKNMEPVPKLNIGQNLAITFSLNEEECIEKKVQFPQKIKNVTKAKTRFGNNVKPQFSVRHICYQTWLLREEDVAKIVYEISKCVRTGNLFIEPTGSLSGKVVEWIDTSNLPIKRIL